MKTAEKNRYVQEKKKAEYPEPAAKVVEIGTLKRPCPGLIQRLLPAPVEVTLQ